MLCAGQTREHGQGNTDQTVMNVVWYNSFLTDHEVAPLLIAQNCTAVCRYGYSRDCQVISCLE